MNRLLLFIILFSAFGITAQNPVGDFSLGLRNTVSFFNHNSNTSLGVGGQFRIRLAERINTEWYADYMSSSDGLINRNDAHIGWSVFYYLLSNKKMMPFVEAGHCFDYTRLVQSTEKSNFAERWSSAVQMGIGNGFMLNENFDITTKLQYMIHLGNTIEAEDGSAHSHGSSVDHAHGHEVVFSEHSHASLEGHLLFTISVNYKFLKLWNRD